MKLSRQIQLMIAGTLMVPFFIFNSCEKSGLTSTAPIISVDATVFYAGDPAADGCGWQISADSLYNVPNLPAQYQINNLKVHIAYQRLNTRSCFGMIANKPTTGYANIQIDSIRTR